ncbi:tRNA (guanine(6)-N2)-methyltransferase [Diplonema papillatum]|nr:tRNA (guanine(6)-N2)-methyltransferase [Diplonema papillatum]
MAGKGENVRYEYLITTSFGMTDILASEICEKLTGRRHAAELEEGKPLRIAEAELRDGLKGNLQDVTITLAPAELCNAALLSVAVPASAAADPLHWRTNRAAVAMRELRSAHDVVLHHGWFPLPEAANVPLAIYDFLKEATCPISVPTLESVKNFRVTCVRAGKHPFHSSDVEMEAGGAFHERYQLPAKMKEFDLCVRVDVHVKTVVVGSLVNTGGPLSKRHRLSFVRTVTLKPNVAYAMLELAKVQDGHYILDPFVGSGTILLEALELYPAVKCWGLDRSAAAVKGTMANVKASQFPCEGRIDCVQGNARTLHKSFDFKFDRIVSNFPWGVKTAVKADIKELYQGALASCWGALKDDGILCCLVLHDLITIHLLRVSGNWDILHARVIKTGGKLPAVIVARKRAQPNTLLSDLRHQRNQMYRYIQDHPKKEKEDEQKEGDGNDEDPLVVDDDDDGDKSPKLKKMRKELPSKTPTAGKGGPASL